MARHFTVTLTSGTNVGPYDIYYDQINTNNFAKLYGTTNNADDLTLAQVQGGVLVTVPNEASTLLLQNTNTTFGTDCPSTTVTYNIPGQPVPTATPAPTSTPQPTAVPPTSTPRPTMALSCFCRTIVVSESLLQDGFGNDLYYVYADCNGDLTQINLATALKPDVGDGNSYVGVCASGASNMFRYGPTDDAFVGTEGMNVITSDTACTANIDCFPQLPTPTPTAVQPTPTPTPGPVTCTEYTVTYPSNASNQFGTWTYTCCDGTSGSLTLGRDQDGIICAQDGTNITSPQGGTLPQSTGGVCVGCGDGAGATPLPTSTPAATPVTYTYWVSAARQNVTDFCELPGYTASTMITSAASSINTLLGQQVYDSNGDPYTGGGFGTYTFISTFQGENSLEPVTPKFVTLDGFGNVDNVGNIVCNGGGGGGGNGGGGGGEDQINEL